MNYWSDRSALVGPSYPTVSWRKGHVDSKIHYFGMNGKTLCGRRIPHSGIGEGDAVDTCEQCLKIAEKRSK